MIAVVFEIEMRDGRTQDYFDLAAKLRPELDKIDGFISVERFQSLANEHKYVSLSFWRDSEAIGGLEGACRASSGTTTRQGRDFP